LKKPSDIERITEMLQNFLNLSKEDTQSNFKTTIENQNMPIFKKLEEKKSCEKLTQPLYSFLHF